MYSNVTKLSKNVSLETRSLGPIYHIRTKEFENYGMGMGESHSREKSWALVNMRGKRVSP